MRRHEGTPPRQTCIIATVGLCRAADWPTFLDGLCGAGADVLRLNLSHADPDYAKEREIFAWAAQPSPTGRPARPALMVDLQGPKTRIGTLPEPGLDLVQGQQVALVPQGDAEADAATAGARIPVPPGLFTEILRNLEELAARTPTLRPRIVFGDGAPVVEVRGLGARHAQGVVVAGGWLGSRKGLTLRDADLDLEAFPEKDQRDLAFAIEHGVDLVAVSFVRAAGDIERVREFVRARIPAGEPMPRLVAKIETLASLQHLDGILAVADAILVARGDLGLQLGLEEVPRVQKQVVAAARRAGRPVIVATQMLESMIAAAAPTRAEATDVFNAIVDGGDAVMLSGETSVGTRPYEVIATMDRLARNAEAYERSAGLDDALRACHDGEPGSGSALHRINEGLALAAVQFADAVQARALVCFTRSGRTAERLARYRPSVPIFAFFGDERRARRAVLGYGVQPIVVPGLPNDEALADLIARAAGMLRQDACLAAGDALVVTAGIDWPRGGTNALQVYVDGVGARSPLG